MPTLDELSRQLASGETSARSLVEDALQRIAHPDGEGARVFISVADESARAQADATDRRRAAGRAPGAFAGIPPLAAFELDANYVRLNALVLRNPSLDNFLDRCSISLPVHDPGEPPVGLMLIGDHGGDERLFAVAHAIERALGSASR